MTTLVDCEPAMAVRPDRFGRSWAGRQITVVGLGRSGIAAAQLLRRFGCRVRATDTHASDALGTARQMLEALGVEAVELGGHTPELVEGSDAVIVSPGVPESALPIRWALAHGVPILSEIELAFHFCPSPVIAVTGTNGKSSTVTLIADVLRAARHPAVACGNLGIPFSSVIDQLAPHTVAVVEVSSFQLLWCHRFQPAIALLLNIGVNHLDRHQDRQAYVAAKARLFQCQTPEQWAVLNGQDAQIAALSERLHATRVWFGENRSNPPAFHLSPQTCRALPESQQAVLQVARLMGIADPLAWQVMRGFRGLPHRLEEVGTVRGVRFVNDSKSTTPDSLLYALERTRGQVVVILGGRDKGLDFTPLVTPLGEARVRGIVLIGESRARLRPLINGASRVEESGTLEEAVRAGFAMAEPGTTVLFSPACASFDMFRDFEDRGRHFASIVGRLAEAA